MGRFIVCMKNIKAETDTTWDDFLEGVLYFSFPNQPSSRTMRILRILHMCYENMLDKNTSQCKILVVPEEGWFGQPKYSTPSSYVVSVSAFVFFILYVKPIRSLLI